MYIIYRLVKKKLHLQTGTELPTHYMMQLFYKYKWRQGGSGGQFLYSGDEERRKIKQINKHEVLLFLFHHLACYV